MDTNNGVMRLLNQCAKAHRWLPENAKFKPLEQLLNRLFRQEITDEELVFLTDKNVLITFSDIALSFAVSLENKRIIVSPPRQSSDASMSAKCTDFLLLIHNKVDPDTLFFRRQLRVEGNTELGLSLKNFLDTIEVDQKLPQPIFKLGDKLASYLQRQKDGIITAS
ncbi:MAG: lipid carrier protein [Idiomarina sp.]|uniref:ubiquinone anaerobic biosynthesis accessory factor UbiT n=1 Tax=Idiomarina sp. TaxID=1874361 RepID=UPI000C5D2FFC|nr:SCP2 sterol-binding domain-containing protein [Idiomarina sp.]MBT41489.1 lipid carrier protein [Idiomarina sp.]